MIKAKKLDADYLATGHHARIEYDAKSGRYMLKKGKDRDKDQSYFLYTLTQDELSRTLMPIGNLTKQEVRLIAGTLDLPVAKKPESQEICFIPDNDYPTFLKTRISEAFHPGPIINLENQILGQHQGIVHFTIGQRSGLRIAYPHALYVLSIDKERNTIIVGPDSELYKNQLLASQVHYISGEKIEKPLAVKARIRYKHKDAEALLTPLEFSQVQVKFKEPQRAITPGQAVVFYEEDAVIGGGIIDNIMT